MSIRSKLILVAIVPVLALLIYLWGNIQKELENKEAAQQAAQDVAVIEKISNLIYELQKERALIVSYVSSGDTKSKDMLFSQRELTDKAVFELNKILKEKNRQISNTWIIDSLAAIRVKADELKYGDADDQLNLEGRSMLLEQISKVLRNSKNSELKNRFEDHLFLLFATDYLAQIRATLGQTIISGKFTDAAYGNFASVKGKYDLNIQKLKNLASPDLLAFFEKKYQGPFVQQTQRIIDSAFVSPGLKNFPFNFDTWYSNATASINLLNEVENFSGDLIRTNAEQELANANSIVIRSVVIAAFVIVLIAIIMAFTIKGIVSSVSRIKNAADRMVKGDVNISLDTGSTDEIGKLASSFNQMIAVSKEYAQVAEIIGRGDYSPVIHARSEADILGIALGNMKNNLQRLSAENETRTWLLTGNSELNDAIRGEKDVRSLAQDVIIQLSAYLKAQIGAIYLRENGQLDLVGSYAFHHRKNNVNSFKPGQGLVGQSALEKKPIVFSEIPDDYIKINSGLGSSAPKNILVFPFLYEGELKGVIEIGTIREISALDLQFLNLAGENIAIAFNAAQSRTQLKELLEETQRQAEELEAQQEEMKQSNEELQEKTELLERSEAELKAQQEELQQTNEELEEKANILEEQKGKLENIRLELETKARELEVTGKYKSEFLANMSHELRTPLNSILILAQILRDNKSKNLSEKEIEFAKNIYSSGTDLLDIINEILDLSKVESGKMELDVTEVPFREIIADISSQFDEIAKSKNISFDIQFNEQQLNPFFTTDKQRLKQILRNLLSNAFRFTEKAGKVSLLIDKCQADITFRNKKLSHVNGIVAFSIKDTGIGIPKEKQEIIFEAFRQADGSTKRKYGGTGLGLSISRELASALGGEIHLQSEEGEGSTFTLYLPLQFSPNMVIPAARTIEIKEKKNAFGEKPILSSEEKITVLEENGIDDRYSIDENDRKILIMEDDIEFAKLLLEFVRERNYKGIIALQGNQGLSYARLYKPDAILLDMKLPVMNGNEVLKLLKNDPALRHIPVQIISGFDMKRESMELGAFDFIRKPVSGDQLRSVFDKIEAFVQKKFKKLLIVEDNELQNKAIKELIGNGDVKCVSAYSGNEAYEVLSKDKVDCIIVDLGLPDMTGFELLDKIKTNDELNKIPVIIYTGKDLTKEENAWLNKFASAIVLKTAHSQERLLDETTLFLHRVESRLPKEKQDIIRKLYKTDEALRNKKVLIVDDDIRNIYSIANVLEEENMHCLTAENGHAALKMLKENPDTDIILMDIMMPEMDGYEATREIRKISKFSKIPIIALTAKAMKGDREKCLATGMSDYVAKPVNIEQLISLMRVWLY